MEYFVRDRKGNDYVLKEGKTVEFFYSSFIGRCFIKIISFPIFSKIVGLFLNCKFSKIMIKKFIKSNNIDMNMYVDLDYKSFNDFFIRKKKSIDFDQNKISFIAPCDSKLMCYKIDENSKFKIKNSFYSISDLLNGNLVYKDYVGGYLLVFRLCADDYHRYIYIDDGNKEDNIFIKGKLNTVRPIVHEYIDIYKNNSREYTILHTENFGDVIQVEVGAVMIGKITNLHKAYEFKKGEEKGYFEFGGSTICLLVKKDVIKIDSDVLNNSNMNIETIVSVGESIGKKL